MNSPAPGWLPDPTGRHEHRYWDGSYWTSDVSDGGVTSFDPYDAPAQPQQPMGFGSGPGYGSGPYAAQPPSGGSGGPSTGLLVGLGAAILVVIVAIVLVVTNKDDDDDADLATDSSEQNDDSGDDDTTTTTGDDGGEGNSEDDQAIVDAMAAGILSTSGDALTQEDADCIAQAMYDEFGMERLMEISTDAVESGSSDPFGGMTSDEVSALMDLMLDCVPAETLAEIGMEQGG